MSNLYVRLAGQWSNDRMVSSEQMSIGGPNGVRAYPNGEAMGDTAWLLTAEWQQNLPLSAYQNYVDITQLYAFVDTGSAKINDGKAGQSGQFQDQNYDRTGVGLGFKVGATRDFLIDMSYGWQVDDSGGASTTNEGQFWMQAVKWFE
jgi:hemolysin activation/secretion protein